MQEIERKFLVKALPGDLAAFPHVDIHQGYLAYEPGERQVRIRRIGDECWLTAKVRAGGGREEVTIPLAPDHFAGLWPLTKGRRLHKTRYQVPHGELMTEIDVYHGKWNGLVVAEVEFGDEQLCRDFIAPDWLDEDVTLNPAYKNTALAV